MGDHSCFSKVIPTTILEVVQSFFFLSNIRNCIDKKENIARDQRVKSTSIYKPGKRNKLP